MGGEDWDDPHDLIPEQFREEFGDSDSVSEALARAESRPSTTDESEKKRCPNCYSTRLRPRRPSRPSTPDDLPAYICQTCETGVDDPTDHHEYIMNDPTATDFEYVDEESLKDPGERGESALLASVDREKLIAVAVVLREPWTDSGSSYREIAELLPYGHGWVGHRVREWRDGEHRELVPDPTADAEPITVDASSASAAVATDGGRRRWEHYGSD